MKKSSKFLEYVFDLTPFSEMCINCVYFVQHYVHHSKDHYAAIDDGHCRRSRRKRCKTYDLCDKFVNKFYDDVEPRR